MKTSFHANSLGLALTVVLMVGCGSFNNNFNHNPLPVGKDGQSDQKQYSSFEDFLKSVSASKTAESVQVNAACLNYKSKEMSKTPAIPMTDLIAAKGDVGEIEKIERRHVEELRAYILQLKLDVIADREQRSAACQTVGK